MALFDPMKAGVDAVVVRPLPKRELEKIFSHEELSLIKANQAYDI
jgi:hypothetical protein